MVGENVRLVCFLLSAVSLFSALGSGFGGPLAWFSSRALVRLFLLYVLFS